MHMFRAATVYWIQMINIFLVRPTGAYQNFIFHIYRGKNLFVKIHIRCSLAEITRQRENSKIRINLTVKCKKNDNNVRRMTIKK